MAGYSDSEGTRVERRGNLAAPVGVKQPMQPYYRRRVRGVCPECEQPSGIYIYCASCRRYHADRMKAKG